MKNILIYGASNSWGNIAGTFNPQTMLHQRYEYGIRWPSVVQKLLGADHHIIEASLNGRSTCFDEVGIIRPSRNGLATLPGILEMNYPLDLVIFMLGTNDVKMQYNASVERIVEGMHQLIRVVKSSHFGRNNQAPKVMLMAPPPLVAVNLPLFTMSFDEAAVEKSRQLTAHYAKLAEEEDCAFMDAAPYVKVSAKDGIHLEQESHETLAKAVYENIKGGVL